MTNEEYVYLFKVCSPKEIMVYTWYGKLMSLKCPFTVKVRESAGDLEVGKYKKVTELIKFSSFLIAKI